MLINVPEVLEELNYIIYAFGFTTISGILSDKEIKIRLTYDNLTLEIAVNAEILTHLDIPYIELVKIVAPAAQMIYAKWCECKAEEIAKRGEPQRDPS